MPATDPPPLRLDDADDARAGAEEVRLRQTLEKLGARSTPPARGRAGGAAGAGHTAPQRRNRFVREGDVPVERMPAPVRSPADLQRELTEERAARQRAEQALADAQARAAILQAAQSQSEQAARAAREMVEEREAAMAGLRAELQRAKVELKAAADEKAAARVEARVLRDATATAKGQQALRASAIPDPQPARWWLPLLQP